MSAPAGRSEQTTDRLAYWARRAVAETTSLGRASAEALVETVRELVGAALPELAS